MGKKIKTKKVILPYVLIAPAILAILSVVAFPIIYSLRLSFFKWNMLRTSVPEFIGLKNYSNILFKDSEFYSSLKVTLIFVIVVVTAELLIGFALALLLNNERVKGMRLISTILISPMVIAPVAIGTTWNMLYNPSIGIVNKIISFFINKSPTILWLGDYKFALIAVMIVDIWQATPFFMLLILAGLKSMPTEPFEAAKVDGASNIQCFKYLTLNFLKPVILIGLVFRVVDAFKEFDKVFMLTRGGPAGTTENFSLYIYRVAFTNYNFGYAAALSVLMLIITGFISWIFIRTIKFEL